MNRFASVRQNIVRLSYPKAVYGVMQAVGDIFTCGFEIDNQTASNNYWSSSAYVDDSSNAWNVNFKNGNTNNNNKSNSNHVRCVRGR